MSFRHLLPLVLAPLLAAGCATPVAPAWRPVPAEALAGPLSLADCLRIARTSDLREARWRARREEAAAGLATARAIPNPVFQPSWEDMGLRDAAGKSLATATYGFSYPVFFWWPRSADIKAAQAQAAAAEADTRAERKTLDEEIGAAFFEMAGARRKAAVGVELLAEARNGARLVREMFKLGSAAGREVELAELEEAQAESELLNAQSDESMKGIALAFALGADRPVRPRLQEEIAEIPPPTTFPEDGGTTATAPPEALFEAVFAGDPACASAKAGRIAAEQALAGAQRRAIPLASAQAVGGPKRAPEGRALNFSFEVPIPLFDWNRAGIQSARAALLSAQAREEEARRTVAARLAKSWGEYQTARLQYRRFRQMLASRERMSGGARELFSQGQVDYAELLRARREWRQSELTAADSWAAMQAAAWRLTVLTAPTE